MNLKKGKTKTNWNKQLTATYLLIVAAYHTVILMYFKKCKNLLWLSWRFCHNCFYKGHVFLLFCLVIHIYIHCCTVFSFQKLMYNWNNMFDHKLVSFDVKSPFTSIPLQLALDCTQNAIKNSTVELPLPTDDIMDLLNLYLTST